MEHFISYLHDLHGCWFQLVEAPYNKGCLLSGQCFIIQFMIFGLSTLVLKNNLLCGSLLMLGFFFFLSMGILVKALWCLILRVD
jgi:hypothetical protein